MSDLDYYIGTWHQCEAVDRRWFADARCVERQGHDGQHVRESVRGNLLYWSDPAVPALAEEVGK